MSYVLGSGSLAILGLHTPSPQTNVAKNYYDIYGEVDVQNFFDDYTDKCFGEVLKTATALADNETVTFSASGGGGTLTSTTASFDAFAVAKTTEAINPFTSSDTYAEIAEFGTDYTITYNSGVYTLTNVSGGSLRFAIGIIDTQNSYVQLPITSESFNPSAEFINSANMSLGRVATKGAKTNSVIDGSLEVELADLHIPYIVYAALGKVIKWDSNITIQPSNKDLPIFDLYIRHGPDDSDNFFKAVGLQVGSFALNLASNAVTTVSLDFNGLTYDTNFDKLNIPPYTDLSNAKYIFPTNITAAGCNFTGTDNTTYDLIDKITAFSLNINNSLVTDVTALNGSGRLAVVPAELEVTGSIEFLLPKNSAFFTYVSGLDVGSRWVKEGTGLNFSFGDDVYANKFILYNMYITNITHDVNDRGALKVSIDYKCVTEGSTAPLEYQALAASTAVDPFALT